MTRGVPTRWLAWWLSVLVVGCWGDAPAQQERAADESPAAAAASWVVVERVVGSVDDPTAPLPWVVAMHGLGDRADRFMRAFDGWQGPATRVLALQAPEPHGAGFTWFPARVGEGRPDVLVPAIAAQAEAVVGALDALRADYAVRGKPVVTGFSQGAILSFAIALRHPDAIAGAVPVAGWIPNTWRADHDGSGSIAPVRALHGEADGVLAWVPLRRSLDRLRARGAPVTYASFAGVGHHVTPPMQRAWHASLVALAPGEGSGMEAPAAVDPAERSR